MKRLNDESLSLVTGGDAINGFCAGLATGAAIYSAGVLTNFWNPVGWASGVAIVGTLACSAYVVSQAMD